VTIQQRKQTVPRVVGRFLAGRCIDGQRRTDATFWQPGSRVLTVHGRASAWAHRPGWQRSVMRVAAIAVISATVYGWLTERFATVASAIGAAVLLCLYAGYQLYHVVMFWSHRRHVVYPLWHVIAGMTGHALNTGRYTSIPSLIHGARSLPNGDRPEKYLSIPRDYRDNPNAVVRLELPYTFESNAAQQKQIAALMSRRLGGDWSASWVHDASPRYMAMCHAPQPPKRVALAGFIGEIDAAPANVLTLGLGASNQVVSIDLDSEAPHIALSMGTGGGKSDTAAYVIAALVRKGCERIDVIDPKRVSHNWARGLPRVYIHRYVAGQIDAINEVRRIMDDRYDAIDRDDTVTFGRRVLLIEEQNSLIEDLKTYWEEYRGGLTSQERSQTPRICPAITDLRYILNKGRQCAVNVISIYQRMSAMAAGGGDARENYGAKILARYSPQTWKILVGTSPVPRPSRVPGRAMYVIGDEHRELQRVHAGITRPDGSADKDAVTALRAFALDGQPDDGHGAGPGPALAAAGAGEPVTLREACETGVISLTYAAARKAKQRDPEFPADRHGLYLPAELQAWAGNRQRSRVRVRAA
jgi:hypothetical protein